MIQVKIETVRLADTGKAFYSIHVIGANNAIIAVLRADQIVVSPDVLLMLVEGEDGKVLQPMNDDNVH